MKLVEDNSALIEQREKEIQHIVSSIADLNQIFQDLSALIVEQVIMLNCELSFYCYTYMISLCTI